MSVLTKLSRFSTREQVLNWLGLGDVSASATFDPGSISDGAGVTTTVSAPGASLGDFVQVSFSLDLQGLVLTGYVESADTVAVRFHNGTGSAVDLAEGTIRVRVTQP